MQKISTLLIAALTTASAMAAEVAPPASAEVQDWYFTGYCKNRSQSVKNMAVKVAIDGADLYLSGIDLDNTANGWAKATLADGVYTFEQFTVMGNAWGYDLYFAGCDDNSDNFVVCTATASEDNTVLTFDTDFMISWYETEPNAYMWYQAGAVLSKNEMEIQEPVITDLTAELPYKNNFQTEARREQVKFYKPESDGSNWDIAADWETGNYYIGCNCDGYKESDDYAVFPGVELEAGVKYTMNFKVRSNSSQYWQYYEVVAGQEAKASKLTEKIIESTFVYSEDWQTAEAESFTVSESGVYYFAIHCTSGAYNGAFSVDDVVIEAFDTEKPQAVESVSITPGRNGELSASIVFSMPTANIAGTAYESGKVLTYTVSRNGDKVAEATAKAGDLVFVTDNGEVEGLTNGNNTYSVVISDEKHVSKECSAMAYIGIDVPLDTNYAEIVDNGDGTITIQWAPAKGVHNGYVGATYNVYSCSAKYRKAEVLNEEPLTTCAYTMTFDTKAGEQGETWFCITTVNSIDESYGFYVSIFTGSPYELPFTEGFADESHIWSFDGDMSGAYRDGWSWSSDEDGYCLSMYSYNWSDPGFATATSGMIAITKGAQMSFDYKSDGNAVLNIVAVTPEGAKVSVLEDCAIEAGAEGTVKELSLDALAEYPYVYIRLEATLNDYYQSLYIDNINIEVVDTPTRISAIEAAGADKVYSIDGKRVAQPAAGLYIVNGQKVMVK